MKVVALLRGINVGGNRIIRMADLRSMLDEMGFRGVRTLLQSGNVVFETETSEGSGLSLRLERAILTRFGFDVDCMIRTPLEWEAAIFGNPFPESAQAEPNRLLVVFFKSEPASEALAELHAALTGGEALVVKGRELYAIYPQGIAGSKLTTSLIESRLKLRGTGRNWNTVAKISKLLH